ncbi:hypothetical protein Acr_08g0011180 [Actinidia rufa]|uniref:Uncharacterized protein n=1 Tax=Actinidia rufa TaxID=165716 RepID=A0A7J0F210_9ERIC|nr:hypothetical protein Acr_08g0011180 [Actinidia rufa]
MELVCEWRERERKGRLGGSSDPPPTRSTELEITGGGGSPVSATGEGGEDVAGGGELEGGGGELREKGEEFFQICSSFFL